MEIWLKYEHQKMLLHLLHWLSSAKTGKARAAIRRYWQDKSLENTKILKKIIQYN